MQDINGIIITLARIAGIVEITEEDLRAAENHLKCREYPYAELTDAQKDLVDIYLQDS